MRYLKYCLLFITLVQLIGACDYLGYSEIKKYHKSDVFNGDLYRYRDNVVNVFSDMIPPDLNPVGESMQASATNDAVERDNLGSVHKMNNGTWSAIQTVDDKWGVLYKGIRDANVFLKNSDLDNFKSRQYNPNYPTTVLAQFGPYPYEVRFLRALFYFQLIKRYENVPLITKVLKPDQANKVKQSSYDEVTQFIVNECDSIAPHLPITYNSKPYKLTGGVTRGTAMALKAKAMLYAASPLHNPSNDLEKWKKAAKAAKAIINTKWYSLDPDYSDIFNNIVSKELIFARRSGKSNYFEDENFPIGYERNALRKNATNPTQNLVDVYEMQKTGLPTTNPNSGYDPHHPYKGRDPRLKETIIVNNSTWKGRKVQIWDGGLDGPPISGATKTGYYLKKYVIENIDLKPNETTTANHAWILFRYGGILLDYAEAMNEAYGPEDPADLGMTARQAVDKIRERSHMPDFPMGMSKAQFRKKLYNERRVEMAFEGQRFWDIRRWKTDPPTTTIKGMEITKNADGSFSYHEKTVEHRVWKKKMFLYPISQNELYKNKNLKQNTGW